MVADRVALPSGLRPLRTRREGDLPDIDGFAASPVPALTAEAMEGDRERFLAAGFDGYLSKPVDIGEFVATVRRYCDGSGG